MFQFFLHFVITASIFAYAALGYNLIFGKGKVLHFGQQAQSVIAVYTLWVLVMMFDVPYVQALVIAIVAQVALSCFLAWLSYRLEPDGLGVMSIALHLALLAVVLNWQSVTRGALGIPKIPRGIFPQTMEGFAIATVGLLILWAAFIYYLDKSKYGRALAALSEHEWHAESLGISRKYVHLIAFIVAGLGSVISAIVYPPYVHLLSSTDYNFPIMIFLVMIVVAGGPGSFWGVILASFGLIGLKEGLRFVGLPADILGPTKLALFGLILFVAVWLRRDSLFPQQRKI